LAGVLIAVLTVDDTAFSATLSSLTTHAMEPIINIETSNTRRTTYVIHPMKLFVYNHTGFYLYM